MWSHRFARRTIVLLEFPSFDFIFASQISPDGMISPGIGKTGLDRIGIIGSDWIVSFFPIRFDPI